MAIKEELAEIFGGAWQYFLKAIVVIKPIWVFFSTVITYLFFPDSVYITPAIGLLIAVVADIVSKYYAISAQNGGFRQAIKNKKIISDSLWRGTKKKLVSVLVVMFLCGLVIRFTPFYPQIAVFVASVCYFIMLFREVQSILENMIDAGHEDLKWMLVLVKRKRKEFMDENNIEDGEENGKDVTP